ncbi:MAG TPA: TonB-dependent receptor [Flavobacterium sp.]|nr:TonB-dependent receptor [Flavobacterium sp.]
MATRKHSLSLLLILCFQFGCAQENKALDTVAKGTPLKEILISARHINDSLLNAPAAIGILSENDLQRNNHSDISTAMNTIPGVLMQSSNITTNRISIRGIGARTPYGTNKIRAFYGSIPLTSGDSETTIEDLDTENISQIEIIKGPLSSVYGAGLGGAIVITPRLSGDFGSEAKISTTYGSFGLIKNSLNYSYDSKSSSLNIGYHKLQTDGWRENSAYAREGITLGGELFRKPNSKLTYFGNYNWLRAFIPSSVTLKSFEESPKAAAPTWIASKGYKAYNSFLGGLAYDWNLSKNISNSTSLFVNYKDNFEPRPFDILGQYTFAHGARTQFSGSFNLGKIGTKFTAGLEYFKDDYSGRNLENLYLQNNGFGTLEGNLLAASNQNREFYNAFAQLRLLLSHKFELQAGVNVNKTKFNLENTYPSTSTEDYSYNAIWSPQASLLFKPDHLKTIYFSLSRGFSLPSVEETLTASGTINSDIKPEIGDNYELGGKFYFGNKSLYTEISLYQMKIKNLLVAERIGDDHYVGVNAGETSHQGIEVLVNYHWRINPVFSLDPNVSASIGKYEFESFNDRGNDFSGNALTGVPSDKINAGLLCETRFGLYVSADFLYVDEIPLNDANSAYADSYNLLNLNAGWKFKIFKDLDSQVSAGVNNIADTEYASLILPNATAVGNAQPRYYYPGLPVNYYGNIVLDYHF